MHKGVPLVRERPEMATARGRGGGLMAGASDDHDTLLDVDGLWAIDTTQRPRVVRVAIHRRRCTLCPGGDSS